MDNKKILHDSIENLSLNNFDTSLIIDNKLCFTHNSRFYRVRMPNQSEQCLAEHNRNLTQLQYLKQEGCITKSQLVSQLKADNIIDFESTEKLKEKITQDLKEYWFRLATKDSGDKVKILEYSDKIKDLQGKLQQLAIEMALYLTPSLENRLEKFYIEYITSLCTEEQIEKEWKAVWNSFDDFNKAESDLSSKALANMTWLLLNR